MNCVVYNNHSFFHLTSSWLRVTNALKMVLMEYSRGLSVCRHCTSASDCFG